MSDMLLTRPRMNKPSAPTRRPPMHDVVGRPAQELFPLLEPGEAPPLLMPAQERAWATMLQRTYGNRATAELLGPPAQRERVIQRTCACAASGGSCEACREKETLLQRRAASNGGASPEVPPIVEEVLGSPGQPLDPGTRLLFERSFGTDFHDVRIHTDEKAAASAREVNALAYTVGKNVVFGADRYAPSSGEGRRLLAHELAHVVQQRTATRSATRLTLGNPESVHEHAADQAVEIFEQRAPNIVSGNSVFGLESVDEDAPLALAISTSAPGGTARPQTTTERWPLAHQLTNVVQQAEGSEHRIQRTPADEETKATEDAEALQKPAKLPTPNKAPSCDEVCGEPDKCIREPGESCRDDNAILAAWMQVASNITEAIAHISNTPTSTALVNSLKANFNWDGKTPANLPDQVKKKLEEASSKMTENLCTKCRPCAQGVVAYIAKARGQNCLDKNCYIICPEFFSSPQHRVHGLTHELLHRVVTGAKKDMYRHQPGYPGKTSEAQNMPDPYASLVDDLVILQTPPAGSSGGKAPAQVGKSP